MGEVPSQWSDPVDNRTSTVLADYKWLPNCHHHVFQVALEQEEGVARVHFAAEVELAVLTRAAYNGSSAGEGYSAHKWRSGTSNSTKSAVIGNKHGGGSLISYLDGESDASRSGEEQHMQWTTIKAVVLVTWTALYIYDTNATVLCYVPHVDMEKTSVLWDAWIWLRTAASPHHVTAAALLCVSASSSSSSSSSSLLLSPFNQDPPQQQQQQDLLFRLVPENESPLAVPRVLLDILSAAHTTGTHLVGSYPNTTVVHIPLLNTLGVPHCPALPLLRYSEIWAEVHHPHSLIAHLSLRHQLACGRPPPKSHNVCNNAMVRWGTAAITEGQGQGEEKEEHKELLVSSISMPEQPQSLLYAVDGTSRISPHLSVIKEGRTLQREICKSRSLSSPSSLTPVNDLVPISQVLKSLPEVNYKKEKEEDSNNNKNDNNNLNDVLKKQVERPYTSLFTTRSPRAIANTPIINANTKTFNIPNKSSTSGATDNVPRSGMITPRACRSLNGHLHFYSMSPSPRIPEITNVYLAKHAPSPQETKERLILPKSTQVCMRTKNEEGTTTGQKSPIVQHGGHTSGVEWDTPMEHMLMLLNKTETASSDHEYARHISQDLLSRTRAFQQEQQQGPLLSPSRVVVVPSDASGNDERNVSRVDSVSSPLSPAADFIACPPLRM